MENVFVFTCRVYFIAENGGRHELRLEPSDKIKPIGSRHSAGMVLEKRAVQIAIDWRNGRNSAAIQVGGSIYAKPCTEPVFSAPFCTRS